MSSISRIGSFIPAYACVHTCATNARISILSAQAVKVLLPRKMKLVEKTAAAFLLVTFNLIMAVTVNLFSHFRNV